MWVQFDSWMPVVLATVGVFLRAWICGMGTSPTMVLQFNKSAVISYTRVAPSLRLTLPEPALKWRSAPLIQRAMSLGTQVYLGRLLSLNHSLGLGSKSTSTQVGIFLLSGRRVNSVNPQSIPKPM